MTLIEKLKDKKALLEMIKELGRILLFVLVAALIDYFLKVMAGLDQSDMFVMIMTLALRGADKWVHENEKIEANGISPF